MVWAAREASREQLDAVYPIARSAFPEWSFAAFVEEFERSRTHLRIAVQPKGFGAEEIVGFCLLWSAPDELHVLNIASSLDFRRMGVGRCLLLDAQGVASRLGAGQLFLEVRVSNEAAIALYCDLGFVKIGERRRYYREPDEDAIVFVKDIELP